MAVLGVVAYHAFPGVVQGGFTGVDVFFVISGFLITQIIARDLQAGRLGFLDFYARRVRRLFPALLITLAATMAIGWRTLYSSEFEQLGKHVAAGAAFISNLVLQREAGYFDYRSDAKPLLHLWSLGVEEQFYLLWPLLLVAAWRITRRLDAALIVVALVSFAGNVVATRIDPTAAFYFPLFRFWELACGGILGLLSTPAQESPRLRAVMGIAGMSSIALGMLIIGSRDQYPGWLVLLPAMGACLVIAGGPANPASRVLSAWPIVAVGTISYPLYLWHWPLLTYASILDGPLPSRAVRATLVLVSVVLAAFTYRYVERPIRASKALRPIAARLMVAMLVVGAAGYAVFASAGVPSRTVARAAEPFITTMARSPRLQECFNISEAHLRQDGWYCHLNASGTPATMMVFGDSHAFALLPAFEAIARQSGADVLFTAAAGCPPLLGVVPLRSDQDVRDCRALNERVFQLVADRQLTDVFLVANWTYYTDGNYAGEDLNVIRFGDTPNSRDGSREAFRRGLASTLAKVSTLPASVHFVQKIPAQQGLAIDLIRDVVTGSEPPAEAIARVSVPADTHRRALQFVSAEFAAQGLVANRPGQIELIDLDEVYCRSGVCPFASPGVSYYFDDNHLSASGALLAGPLLAKHVAGYMPSARLP